MRTSAEQVPSLHRVAPRYLKLVTSSSLLSLLGTPYGLFIFNALDLITRNPLRTTVRFSMIGTKFFGSTFFNTADLIMLSFLGKMLRVCTLCSNVDYSRGGFLEQSSVVVHCSTALIYYHAEFSWNKVACLYTVQQP